MEERLWSVKEIAEYLQVTPCTVYRLINAGKIPMSRVGGAWRGKKEILEAWMDKQMGEKP